MSGKYVAEVPPRRADADALAGHVGDGPDVGVLQHQELEGRIVHRENRPHRAGGRLACPYAGPVPRLQRHAHGDEAEFCLARFQQRDIFGWPFRRSGDDRKIERARQDLGEALAIYEVGAAGRGGTDCEVIGPIRFGGPAK